MTIRDGGQSSVIVFGRSTDLCDGIVTCFERHGVEARHAHPSCDVSQSLSRWSTGHSVTAQLAGADDSVDSIVLVVDQEFAEALFDRRRPWASRRRLTAYENDVSELAVTTALHVGARRLLIVCDARLLSFGQRVRAIGWARDLTRRVGYECAVNGLHGLATRYAVIDSDGDVLRAAAAAVNWHAHLEVAARCGRRSPVTVANCRTPMPALDLRESFGEGCR